MRPFVLCLLALPFAGLANEIAPASVRKVNRPSCELSLVADMGREVESCGMRIVSDPSRWISYSPHRVKIFVCEDPNGQWPVRTLADGVRLKPAFCAESQFVVWSRAKARYLRVDVLESGWRGVVAAGMAPHEVFVPQ